jgi:hypothetical protein
MSGRFFIVPPSSHGASRWRSSSPADWRCCRCRSSSLRRSHRRRWRSASPIRGADAAALVTNVTQVMEHQRHGGDQRHVRPWHRHRRRADGVQARLRSAEPRLPEEVRRQGILVRKASTGFLQIVAITSKSGATSNIELGNFAETRVVDELRRVPGVGDVVSFSSPYAMRVWLDPESSPTFSSLRPMRWRPCRSRTRRPVAARSANSRSPKGPSSTSRS